MLNRDIEGRSNEEAVLAYGGACAAAIVMLTLSSADAQSQNWKWCAKLVPNVTPDMQIFGCKALIKSDSTSRPDAAFSYNLGNGYYDKQDYQLAIANYNDALRIRPRDVHALKNRGERITLAAITIVQSPTIMRSSGLAQMIAFRFFFEAWRTTERRTTTARFQITIRLFCLIQQTRNLLAHAEMPISTRRTMIVPSLAITKRFGSSQII